MLCLAVDCSSIKGSVALRLGDDILSFKSWDHKAKEDFGSHSSRLPFEIDQILKKSDKKLSDVDFFAVGRGPGRWTSLRSSLQLLRGFSFALQKDIYAVNSLRVCAEPFLQKNISPVFTSINAFKNQVYFASFKSPEDLEGEVKLLEFPDWVKKMEALEKKHLCLSDLSSFYSIPASVKENLEFLEAYPSAKSLSEIVFRQKKKRPILTWKDLEALYFKKPTD